MVLVTERIHIFDAYLLMQEYLNAEKITPKVYIESPLIKGFNYYLKASGIYTSIYGTTLGDQMRTEDFVNILIRKNKSTDIRVVIAHPGKDKYKSIFDMVGELEFLLFLAQRGARLYFLPLDQHHKKYFITNFGVLTGSANYTPSSRYLVPQSTFFFDAGDPTYKECLDDFEKEMKKAEDKGKNTISYLQENLTKLKGVLRMT